MWIENARKILPAWAKNGGDQTDVVLASRARLARNLQDLSFPGHASEATMKEVLRRVEQAVNAIRADHSPLKLTRMEDLPLLERQILVEKHLVSPQHIERPQHRAVILNADESVSTMVNEEDHLRIQAILPGQQISEATAAADKMDDLLEERLDYAFHEEKGYLTACPTNTGTGMRVSVMVHLPALSMIDQTRRLLSALSQIGLNVRGIYGEGSEAYGDIYQISNQMSLGRTEEEILYNLQTACAQLVESERTARDAIVRDSKLQVEDKVWRAFGTLSQARLLTSEEALRLTSDVKLGTDLKIIPDMKSIYLKELLFVTSPGILQKIIGREMSPGERDQYRAMLVRDLVNPNK
ncbi:MAG TPA: protein arginine kinase [Firmicutes bacterium]|nr:protein arginine kinase [Bacillota bacterium]HBL67615.1 protein arginine kinase [Bacillota bacterium]HBR24615.1 protein arginine kinase [Bacillota bacterium]